MRQVTWRSGVSKLAGHFRPMVRHGFVTLRITPSRRDVSLEFFVPRERIKCIMDACPRRLTGRRKGGRKLLVFAHLMVTFRAHYSMDGE
jgi:hypothetical protein